VVPARQVEREGDVAGGRVDQTRRAEHDPADPLPRGVRPVGRLDHRGVHHPHRVVRTVRGHLDPARYRAGDVGRGRDDLARTDLHPDHVRAVRHDRVQLGVGPPAPGELADPGHQLALLEPLDQLAGGDLGQAGEFTELGAGERTAVEQQFERGPVVDRAQQARSAGQARLTHSGNAL
jgi:hypothetical protein